MHSGERVDATYLLVVYAKALSTVGTRHSVRHVACIRVQVRSVLKETRRSQKGLPARPVVGTAVSGIAAIQGIEEDMKFLHSFKVDHGKWQGLYIAIYSWALDNYMCTHLFLHPPFFSPCRSASCWMWTSPPLMSGLAVATSEAVMRTDCTGM